MTGKLGAACRVPRCPEIVTDRSGYCFKHKDEAPKPFSQKRVERLDFYSSVQWRRLRRMKLARNPICQKCNRSFATAVHHVKEARLFPELRFDLSNLESICHSCHAAESQRESVEAKKRTGLGAGNSEE